MRHETEDKRRFDCLVVESTGVSDPRSVAQAFATDEDLATRARLDTLVTVVDASAFSENFSSVNTMMQTDMHDGHDHATKEEAEACEDSVMSENVVDLLVSQVEFEKEWKEHGDFASKTTKDLVGPKLKSWRDAYCDAIDNIELSSASAQLEGTAYGVYETHCIERRIERRQTG